MTDRDAAKKLLALLADKFGSFQDRPYAEMLPDVTDAISAARRRGREEVDKESGN